MVQLQVTLVVTLLVPCLAALINDTSAPEEGSGTHFEDILATTTATSTLAPPATTTNTPATRTTTRGGPSLVRTISKRAADYYNGIVDAKFYWPFNAQRPTFPPNAVMGMGRPLQRSGQIPRTEYVVLWTPRGGAPHWGTVYLDQKLQVEGTFVDGNTVVNLTSGAVTPTRLLQYVGTQQSNNFKFQWIVARDVDPATVIVQKQSGLCNARVAPAVFQDSGFEFLGEADIDNRSMKYVYNSQVHVVDSAHFTNQVYLLTKQRCSCSCS